MHATGICLYICHRYFRRWVSRVELNLLLKAVESQLNLLLNLLLLNLLKAMLSSERESSERALSFSLEPRVVDLKGGGGWRELLATTCL